MKIRKKSGEHEDFDRNKLERSLLNAGASADVAKRVSERIKLSEGLSTDDLRMRVAEELLKENAALSGAYLSSRSLIVRTGSDLTPGNAGVHTEHTRGLRPNPGAVLFSANKRAEVRLQHVPSASPREIHLSKADMDGLGVQEGSRIAVRFPL